MRVLVTAGGTEEPIDGVRRIANHSTGATGSVIAERLAADGAEVVLLHAARTDIDAAGVDHERFVTFADLEESLRRILGKNHFDAVIHLAAVSDYRVAAVEVDGQRVPHGRTGKIPSGHDVVLRLRPTPKLVDRLRSWSLNPTVRVVAFKLTNDPDLRAREAAVFSLLDRGAVDLVVHNDLAEIGDGTHRAVIWSPAGPIATTTTKPELAAVLAELITTGAGPTTAVRRHNAELHGVSQ